MNSMRQMEDEMGEFLAAVCDQYEKTAPTVHSYCDDLYRRMMESPQSVNLYELRKVCFLRENGVWLQPNYAANYVYHLMSECGMSTVGQAGF